MKSLFILTILLIALFLALPNEVAAQKKTVRTIEGKISDYDCGDNCYLTITDKKGKKHHGLCSASICSKWNESTVMPKSYKGKRVRVTVGKRTRYDGGGGVMDKYDAFVKIQFKLLD